VSKDTNNSESSLDESNREKNLEVLPSSGRKSEKLIER
jgi:hypothetical protein